MSAQIVSIGTYLSIALIDTTCISFSERSEISKARLHVMIQIKSIPYNIKRHTHPRPPTISISFPKSVTTSYLTLSRSTL